MALTYLEDLDRVVDGCPQGKESTYQIRSRIGVQVKQGNIGVIGISMFRKLKCPSSGHVND
jgi:hypothetical protein